MQQTLSVLQTLRSSERVTAAAKRSASAPTPATSHAAGPVEADRHAGLAGDGAELGDGGPRAPGHREARRGWENIASAGRPRWRERERGRAPAAAPLRRARASSACSWMAMAVPSASRPMRKTTVLPPRSTPVASAKTFGRPSNTNPITPSGRAAARPASPGSPSTRFPDGLVRPTFAASRPGPGRSVHGVARGGPRAWRFRTPGTALAIDRLRCWLSRAAQRPRHRCTTPARRSRDDHPASRKVGRSNSSTDVMSLRRCDAAGPRPRHSDRGARSQLSGAGARRRCRGIRRGYTSSARRAVALRRPDPDHHGA